MEINGENTQVSNIKTGILKNIAVLKFSENSQENTHGCCLFFHLFILYFLLTDPIDTIMNKKVIHIYEYAH